MERVLTIFFLFFYVAPLVVVAFHTNHIYSGMQVLIALFGYFIGLSIVRAGKRNPVDHSAKIIVPKKLIYILFVCYLILSSELVFNSIYQLANGGFSIWALELAVQRYEETAVVTNFEQLSTIIFIAICALIGSGQIKWTSILMLTIMIFVESIGLSRSTVLLGLVSIFVNYIIVFNKRIQLMQYSQLLKYLTILLALLLCVFLYSAYMRIHQLDEYSDILFEKFLSYTLAMYESLLIWMDNGFENSNMIGFGTFTFIYKIIGYQVPAGFYEPVETAYGSTNIFMTLRGLISDLGVINTFLFFTVSGFFVKYFTYHSLGFFSYQMVRIFLYLIFFIIYSPFIFTTVAIGYVLAGLLIAYFSNRNSTRC